MSDENINYPELEGSQPSAPVRSDIEDEIDENVNDNTMDYEEDLNKSISSIDLDEVREPEGTSDNTGEPPTREPRRDDTIPSNRDGGISSPVAHNTRSRSTGNSAQPQEELNEARHGREPRFTTNPELHEYFSKVFNSTKKIYENECKLCGKIFASHNIDRLCEHLSMRCPSALPGIKSRFKKDASEEMSSRSKHYWNFRWARIVVKNSLPLRLQSCPLFRSFMKDLGLTLASRDRLGGFYIEKLARRTDNRFSVLNSSLNDNSLSIEFDHWTDSVGRSVLGTVATFSNGAKHLLSLQDVSTRGHGNEVTIDCLMRTLSSINSRKINSIVSDNASSCQLARTKLTEEEPFKHLLSHRCIAHWLNLIGRAICKTDAANDIIFEMNSIINDISKDVKILGMLREAQIRRCTRSVPTRWYSTVISLASLSDIRKDVFDLITRTPDFGGSNRANILRSLNEDRSIWADIKRLLAVLCPLASCIAVAEESGGYLSQPVKKILEFAKLILGSDWTDEFVLAALESFFLYFSMNKLKEEYGLLLAAYALDPENNMNYLTKACEQFILVHISAIAKLSGFKNTSRKRELAKEFAKYAKRERPFNGPVVDGGPDQWWLQTPDITILRKVALRICSLRPSSANIERVFSTLKYIQAPNRLNFALGTIENIAKVRIAEYHDNNLSALDSFDLIEYDDGHDKDSEQNDASQGSQRESRLSRMITKITGRSSGDEVSLAQPNHRPTLFKTMKVRESYYKFMSFFDFSIVRTYGQIDMDTTIEISDEEFLDDLVRDYAMHRG